MRNLPTRYILPLMVLSALCSSGTELNACECVQTGSPSKKPTASDLLGGYDAVFFGLVTNIRLIELPHPISQSEFYYDPDIEVTIKVWRAWKGVAEPSITLITASQAPACGYSFKAGQYYLVYSSRRGQDNRLATDVCTPTKESNQAQQDMVTLGAPLFQIKETASQ